MNYHVVRPLIHKSSVKQYFHDRDRRITAEAMELIEQKITQLFDHIITEQRRNPANKKNMVRAIDVNQFKVMLDI